MRVQVAQKGQWLPSTVDFSFGKADELAGAKSSEKF
jgi:hypothetical protein